MLAKSPNVETSTIRPFAGPDVWTTPFSRLIRSTPPKSRGSVPVDWARTSDFAVAPAYVLPGSPNESPAM